MAQALVGSDEAAWYFELLVPVTDVGSANPEFLQDVRNAGTHFEVQDRLTLEGRPVLLVTANSEADVAQAQATCTVIAVIAASDDDSAIVLARTRARTGGRSGSSLSAERYRFSETGPPLIRIDHAADAGEHGLSLGTTLYRFDRGAMERVANIASHRPLGTRCPNPRLVNRPSSTRRGYYDLVVDECIDLASGRLRHTQQRWTWSGERFERPVK